MKPDKRKWRTVIVYRRQLSNKPLMQGLRSMRCRVFCYRYLSELDLSAPASAAQDEQQPDTPHKGDV